MSPFQKLKALRTCQRTFLPGVRSAADLDIVLEVGAAQESNRPIGTKGLFKANLASPATISRRLERLKKLKVVEQRAASGDRRRRDIVLCAPVYTSVQRLARRLRKIFSA